MITILAPSKTLDFSDNIKKKKYTQPQFAGEVKMLVDTLKQFSRPQLSKLMNINPQLADLNYERFQTFKQKHLPANSKQALLAFKGDVYRGFELENYKAADLDFAQKHLRILSGLYGVLRPLDLIQRYRLEMGTKLKNPEGKDLYACWGDKLTNKLLAEIEGQRTKKLVNLASQEYFKAVDDKRLDPYLLEIDFKEYRDGRYKTVPILAKMARGLMANFIIQNRIDRPEHLKAFDVENYHFNEQFSTLGRLVFTR